MKCDLCNRPIQPDETVVMEQYGQIVAGEFTATEEPSIHHDECEEF